MAEQVHQSKIFIRQLTVLDCGVWDHTHGPQGRSWSVDVFWTGKTDHEGVVVDFSSAKKLAKNAIDENFDHRLLISDSLLNKLPSDRFLCLPHPNTRPENRFLLDSYRSSLAILSDEVIEGLGIGNTALLERELAVAILSASPKNITEVKVQLRPHQEVGSPHFFNYLHSLRLHSGNCQRFHGHSNTIEVFSNDSFNAVLSKQAAEFLNNKYLVTPEYIRAEFDLAEFSYSDVARQCETNPTTHACAEYEGSQGSVRLFVPRNRLLLLPEESTIENIASWVHKVLFDANERVTVFGFEGLNKGAIAP